MRTLLCSLALAAFLAACGYKGPLYLPKPKAEPQPLAAAPAQAPKKDGATSQ